MKPMTALHRPFAGALLVLALVTGACGSPPTASPAPTGDVDAATPPAAAEPTSVPGTTGDPGAGGGGGSQPGNPGGGGAVPVDPNPGVGDPGNFEPTLVVPNAGATGVREVGAAKLEASVSGRAVTVRIAWWSGVEPCYVLAGVNVVQDGRTITLTVLEGSGAGPDAVCIEIAVYKATVVELGELEPGTWTIRAHGDAAPIEVTVAS